MHSHKQIIQAMLAKLSQFVIKIDADAYESSQLAEQPGHPLYAKITARFLINLPAMNIPSQLCYTPHHLWTEAQPDGTVCAGITDHAQDTLGDIVFVDAPAIGSAIQAGQPCGLIESVKTGSDLHAPLSGRIVEINQALQTTPEQINDTPYTAWIFRIQPDQDAAWDQPLDAAGYRRLLDQ